jgi:DNA-binding beta-propeller fold protein YncE
MVGIVMDDSGNIIIPDVANHTIRKLSRAGVVTTLAGTPGVAGATDGAGADAHFREPTGLALDKAGNLYVADTGNHTIRKVTPKGVVTTLAGTPGKGGREDGQGAAASFQSPEGIAVDASGTLFVVDVFYSNIRRISPEGLVTTPAWQTADRALFCITGITIDEAGNLYASDHCNYAIHKITPAGEVTTLAGGGPLPGGGKDGVGAAARFSWPAGLAVDDAGNVFVADFGNDAIRRVTPTGVVSTVVGALASTNYGNFPGPLPASLVHPVGVAVDPATSRLFIVLPDAIMTVGP